MFYPMTNIFFGQNILFSSQKDTRNEGIRTMRMNPINLNRQLSKTKKLEHFKNLQPDRNLKANKTKI